MLLTSLVRGAGLVSSACLLLALAGAPDPAAAQSKDTGPRPGAESSGSSSKSVSRGIESALLLLGDNAPDFRLRTPSNQEVRFQTWRGSSSAVILFLDHAEELEEEYGKLATRLLGKNVRTVAVCRRTVASPAALAETEMAFPILRDRWGDVARQYGAVDRLNGDAVPAIVIVDAKGKVRYLSAGAMPEPTLLETLVYGVLEKEEAKVY